MSIILTLDPSLMCHGQKHYQSHHNHHHHPNPVLDLSLCAESERNCPITRATASTVCATWALSNVLLPIFCFSKSKLRGKGWYGEKQRISESTFCWWDLIWHLLLSLSDIYYSLAECWAINWVSNIGDYLVQNINIVHCTAQSLQLIWFIKGGHRKYIKPFFF